jgi:hypothetical protein
MQTRSNCHTMRSLWTCRPAKLLVLLVLIQLERTHQYLYNGGYENTNATKGNFYSGYQSRRSSSYNSSYYLDMDPCDYSVVQVTQAHVSCDSPYTFYYGNGANRNSPYCDYGDKATFSIGFQVKEDIDQIDDIYMTMAIYDTANNLLASTQPQYLCESYVGSSCTTSGTYSFSIKLKFDYVSANATKFEPVVRMAFSAAKDHGYDLGAVNIDCPDGKTARQSYVAWHSQTKSNDMKDFMFRNGLLLLTGTFLVAMALFLWRQAGEYQNETYQPNFRIPRHLRLID